MTDEPIGCPHLDANLDAIAHTLVNDDSDYLLVVSGVEGAGKSNLATYCCQRVDPLFSSEQAVYDLASFIKQIQTLAPGRALMIDEGLLLAFSRDYATAGNKGLIKVISLIRRCNLFVVLVITDFNMLDKYLRTHRVNSLLVALRYYNDGTKKYVRGNFACFSNRSIKRFKTYSNMGRIRYPRPDFYENVPSLKGSGLWSEYRAAESKRKAELIDNELKNIQLVTDKRAGVFERMSLARKAKKLKEKGVGVAESVSLA